MPDAPALASRAVRSFTRGLLRLDEVFHPCRFVLDPATGHPVLPMPRAWDPRSPEGSDDAGVVLYLPDDSDPAAQLVVTPTPLDPRSHGAADRWRAYHGEAREPAWALLRVESVRFGGEVFDGDEVIRASALRADEPRLVRELNADRARLAAFCRGATGIDPESPLAVGVDPDGVDVRASLGVIRAEFERPCPDADAARREIDALIARSRG